MNTPAEPPRPDGWRAGLELVWYIAVGFGVFLVASFGLALAFPENSLLGSAATYATNFVCFAGAAYWLGVRRRGRSLAEFGLRRFNPAAIMPTLLVALAVLPLRLVAAVIIDWLAGAQNLQPRLDLMVPPGPAGLTFAVTLLGAGLLAPLAEELYFRGLLHGWLQEHLGFWPRVLLSSALFGLGHFDNAGLIASTFIMGLVCAVAYERSRSLWLPVLVHAVNNSLAVALLYAALAVNPTLH